VIGGFTPLEIARLVAAGAVVVAGVVSLFLARSNADSSIRKMRNMRRIYVLSEPTFAVIAVGCAIGAHQLAAPVFHWPGVRSPMGALAALALIAAAGSICLDVAHHKSDMNSDMDDS
jgi:uncharacterized membrane protein